MSATMRDLGAELDAPVLVCLEGGYAPRALAASVVATITALDGDREPSSAPRDPAGSHLERLRRRWDL
jgi:acetoin utilization deacetylase AcuC-like enzyme